MARGRSEEFKTPTARLSYAFNLFEARENEEKTKKSFGCTFIFPAATSKAVFEKAILEAAEAEWPGQARNLIASGMIRSPFLKGDGPEARRKKEPNIGALHPGMGPDVWFIRATANEDRPPVVRWKSPNIPATKAEVYSGCYGFAVLSAFTWSNSKGGMGVSFGLAYVQKTAEGEPLGGDAGGQVDPNKWHEKIEDAGAAPDSTKNGAGAGGLFG